MYVFQDHEHIKWHSTVWNRSRTHFICLFVLVEANNWLKKQKNRRNIQISCRWFLLTSSRAKSLSRLCCFNENQHRGDVFAIQQQWYCLRKKKHRSLLQAHSHRAKDIVKKSLLFRACRSKESQNGEMPTGFYLSLGLHQGMSRKNNQTERGSHFLLKIYHLYYILK